MKFRFTEIITNTYEVSESTLVDYIDTHEGDINVESFLEWLNYFGDRIINNEVKYKYSEKEFLDYLGSYFKNRKENDRTRIS